MARFQIKGSEINFDVVLGVITGNGGPSRAALTLTGTPYAGTGSNSYPLLYINDSAATASTTLDTSGTCFGINTHTAGTLINLMKDGVSKFAVGNFGGVQIAGALSPVSGSELTLGSGTGAVLTLSGRALNLGGNTNSAARLGQDAVNGFTFQSAAGTATWNDASTGNSGTIANRYLLGIAAPTLTSTGTSVTYTVANSFYIGGGPTASTNVTITSPYALNVAAGVSIFGGPVIFPNYTVAGLPSTAATGKVSGAVALVTDSATTVITGLGLAPTGGSTNKVMVYCDGTNWLQF